MTLGELKQQVFSNLGRSDTEVALLVTMHTNTILKHLSTLELHDMETQQDTTLLANSASVDLLPDWQIEKVYSVLIKSGDSRWSELESISHAKWAKLYSGNPTSSSRPTVYSIYNKKLWVYPIADQDYTVRIYYYKYHPSVTNDNDEIQFERCKEAIPAIVTGMCWLSLEEVALSDKWLQFGISLLKALTGVDEKDLYSILPKSKGSNYIGEYWKDPFIRRV